MRVDDFDYYLPQELIAQHPAERRDGSRLLVVHRDTGLLEHRQFPDMLEYLRPGDCLVMNDSRVIPARLRGFKQSTGAKAEFLLLSPNEDGSWNALVRPGKKLKPGDIVRFSDAPFLEAEIEAYGPGDEGIRRVRFRHDGVFMEVLEQVGAVPLPPYIDREAEPEDRQRYQTVYSRFDGSVAAPTAGLHFTEELLQRAREQGVETAFVTLHVGIGTFRPVKTETVEAHHMHFEEYEISPETAETINRCKAAGGRIIAVGTTSVRTLESNADEAGRVTPCRASTDIFIYPGYRFKIIDALFTNFHLPKSTLLMLISAFYDREAVLELYRVAVQERYRFFSYGDSTLFL